MDDYEIDDERECPKCGHSPIHFRTCNQLMCDEGKVDVSDDDYLLPGSAYEVCHECKGTGTETWCPGCGENLSGFDFNDDEQNDDGK